MVRAPVGVSRYPFLDPVQRSRRRESVDPGKLVLRLTRVVVIKAPPLYFVLEVSAVKQLSGAADVVAIPPEARAVLCSSKSTQIRGIRIFIACFLFNLLA